MNRTFLVIVGIAFAVIVIVALVGILGVGRVPPPPVAGAIEVWGFTDDENTWQDIINRFQALHQNITVSYKKFNTEGYEDMLVNRLAEYKGPDIFFLPHTWVAKHRDKIFPLPAQAGGFSVSDFKNAFVDGAADDLISSKGEILGMPMFMDTLALFYNKDIFNAAGVAQPPKTWDDAATLARTLTRVRTGGDIQQSGMALGSAKNIEHSFEIVSALMLQKSAIIPSASGFSFAAGAGEALGLYASFADPAKKNFSWTATLPNSLDAFAVGDAAMMVGFASDIGRVRERNPHLNFGIAPLPQMAGSARSADWGDYFFPAVSRASPNKEIAWQFIVFASSRDGVKSYLDATRRPPARRDLAGAGTASEDLAVFWSQSLIARSWPVPDEGPSRRLFGDAIDAVAGKQASPTDAVSRLENQLHLLVR